MSVKKIRQYVYWWSLPTSPENRNMGALGHIPYSLRVPTSKQVFITIAILHVLLFERLFREQLYINVSVLFVSCIIT